MRTSADFSVVVDQDERSLRSAYTVVIASQEPEGWMLEAGELDAGVLAALALVRPELRVVTICTGSFVLGATELLDGLAPPPIGGYARTFAAVFPRVEVRPDVLFVDNGRLLTSGGSRGDRPLPPYSVSRHGAEVANAAARRRDVPGAMAVRPSSSSTRWTSSPTPPLLPPGSGC